MTNLEYLRDPYHAPIEFDRAHPGYYYTEPTFRLALPQFTQCELIALFLDEQMMHQFRGTQFSGHCHLRADIRMFAVQRALSLRDTGETFDRPADFRVEDYLIGSFRAGRGNGDYLVVLRFGRDVARRFAEKRLHTNQVLEPQAHGTPIARMHIVVSEFASPGTRVQFPPPPLLML
jgi:predicted DNA-binding transcriptional regulator YafY